MTPGAGRYDPPDPMTIPLTTAERFAFCCIVVAEFAGGRLFITSDYRTAAQDGKPRQSYHQWRHMR